MSYEQLANYYDMIYDRPEAALQVIEFCKWAFTDIADIPVSTILDAAAGTGLQTIPLSQQGYDVTAADPSLEMLNVLRGKLKDKSVPILNWDVRELDFESRFDAVLMIGAAFNHLLSDDDAERGLKVIHRALNPGGIFIFDISNFYNLFGRYKETEINTHESDDIRIIQISRRTVKDIDTLFIHDETTLVEQKGTVKSFHEVIQLRMYTRHEIERLLREAGFQTFHCFRGWQDRKEEGSTSFRLVFVAKKQR